MTNTCRASVQYQVSSSLKWNTKEVLMRSWQRVIRVCSIYTHYGHKQIKLYKRKICKNDLNFKIPRYVQQDKDSHVLVDSSAYQTEERVLRKRIAYRIYDWFMFVFCSLLYIFWCRIFSEKLIFYFRWYDMGRTENNASNNSFIVSCVFLATVTILPSRCLAAIRGYTYRHRKMEEYHEVCCWNEMRCHDVHTKFHQKFFSHSTVDGGNTQTHRQHGDCISKLNFFST
jgi:hypothetical protein